MTIAQLVHRERQALLRAHVAATILVTLAAMTALLAVASVALGDARWMSLPRALPFVIWAVIIGANVAAWLLLVRALRHEGNVVVVSAAVEREQSLRTGSVRGTMEVAESGSLGRKASDALVAKLSASRSTLVPQTRRRARRRV